MLTAVSAPTHAASRDPLADHRLARCLDGAAPDRQSAVDELGVAHALAVLAEMADNPRGDLGAFGVLAQLAAVVADRTDVLTITKTRGISIMTCAARLA